MQNQKNYPEGHFISLGIAFGLPLGLALAGSLKNPGLIGIGIPVGLAVGLALEEKYKKEGKIRPLNEAEQL